MFYAGRSFILEAQYVELPNPVDFAKFVNTFAYGECCPLVLAWIPGYSGSNSEWWWNTEVSHERTLYCT